MILARISRAIRTQNWFAVVLEFVIVVMGVVIGFQINGWAQDRTRQARADVMMDRLAVDLEAEHWRITATSRYSEDVVSEAEIALDAMEGRRQVSDEQLVIKAFRGTQYFWAGIIRSAYDELVASGEIDLVPQGVFRDAVIEYYNSSPGSLLSDLGNTPYRDAFRLTLSPALHRSLAANCAENPNVAIGDYESLENYISFSCEIDGFDAEIETLAARLRSDARLTELLRQRIIEADQSQLNLRYFDSLLSRALADYSTGANSP